MTLRPPPPAEVRQAPLPLPPNRGLTGYGDLSRLVLPGLEAAPRKLLLAYASHYLLPWLKTEEAALTFLLRPVLRSWLKEG